MNPIFKLFTITIAMATCFTLSACSPRVHGTTYPQMMQDHRLTRPINHDLLTEMNQDGVVIIRQGSRVQFVLPIVKFFELGTFNVRENKLPTLEMLSLYLHIFVKTHYTTYPIKVYAYTNTVPMYADQYEYSKQYAQVIGSYLWAHGFLPSQMRVVGYGAENPIANGRTAVGSGYNERVVIQVN